MFGTYKKHEKAKSSLLAMEDDSFPDEKRSESGSTVNLADLFKQPETAGLVIDDEEEEDGHSSEELYEGNQGTGDRQKKGKRRKNPPPPPPGGRARGRRGKEKKKKLNLGVTDRGDE